MIKMIKQLEGNIPEMLQKLLINTSKKKIGALLTYLKLGFGFLL